MCLWNPKGEQSHGHETTFRKLFAVNEASGHETRNYGPGMAVSQGCLFRSLQDNHSRSRSTGAELEPSSAIFCPLVDHIGPASVKRFGPDVCQMWRRFDHMLAISAEPECGQI